MSETIKTVFDFVSVVCGGCVVLLGSAAFAVGVAWVAEWIYARYLDRYIRARGLMFFKRQLFKMYYDERRGLKTVERPKGHAETMLSGLKYLRECEDDEWCKKDTRVEELDQLIKIQEQYLEALPRLTQGNGEEKKP